jgi:hypothetical protein
MPFTHAQYYKEKTRYLLDDELVYRYRPSLTLQTASFTGDLHLEDFYRLHEKPVSYSVAYDNYGLRNGPMPEGGWDLVVLGDSFVEFGQDEEDTLTSRLARLTGLRPRNLGVAGYGPFQYLTSLKRYGLSPKPKVVLFCFFEGNDISDTKNYLGWRETGQTYGHLSITGTHNLFQRYLMALTDVFFVPLVRAIEGDQASSADLVILKVGDRTITTVLKYKNETRTPKELWHVNEWVHLKDVLGQLKALCAENDVTPMVVFIPSTAHIYAEYSTHESGANWLSIRDQQIAAKDNVETALSVLCQQMNIEIVSLSSAFSHAASLGRLLYYPFDSHWNSEGRQVAAMVLADKLSASP